MRVLFLTGLALAAAASPAAAQSAYGPSLVRLSVVDRDTGRTARVWLHNRRAFVAGETGHRYSLRLENATGEWVLVVLSVDGVNVISGATASFTGRGYILAPHEGADINGWRKNQDEIAVFRFAPLSHSYAARTGRPNDVGVIGMAVFREKPLPPPPPVPMDEASRDGIARRAPGAPSPANKGFSIARPESAERLGTAHGEIEHDYSGIAPFEKASARPEQVRAIEYDSQANLVAAGVIPRPWRRPPPSHPRPFPRENEGYVPDPPPGS